MKTTKRIPDGTFVSVTSATEKGTYFWYGQIEGYDQAKYIVSYIEKQTGHKTTHYVEPENIKVAGVKNKSYYEEMRRPELIEALKEAHNMIARLENKREIEKACISKNPLDIPELINEALQNHLSAMCIKWEHGMQGEVVIGKTRIGETGYSYVLNKGLSQSINDLINAINKEIFNAFIRGKKHEINFSNEYLKQ